ncbi:MAG: class I SAM-dependent methyltransferase [Myxococcota bacterium]
MYRRLAAVYDPWTRLTESRSLLTAVAKADIRDGESVLEVAVGTGFVFRELLRRNPSGTTVGIDLTPEMLRRTRAKAEKTRVPFSLLEGDARKLPFADGAFDVVLSGNMLGLLSDADAVTALREMARVLRPGGRLVLITMTCPRSLLSGWIYRLGAMRLGGWRDVHVEPLVREVGFEQVRRTVVSQLGVPSEVLVAWSDGC